MCSVFRGMRRRLSLPFLVGSFVIAAFIASTSLASAEEVVIGLPATPPPPTLDLDFAAPDDDEPDPPAPQHPFDITDGDGGDPNPPGIPGPDDFTDGDGGDPDPTPPPGPDDVADADPSPQDPGDPVDVPADDPVESQTFGTTSSLVNVSALPVTGTGNGPDHDQSELVPLFVLLSATCLLATGLLTVNPGTRNHTGRH